MLDSLLSRIRKTIWVIHEKDFEGLLKEGFSFSLQYFLIIFVIGLIPTSILSLAQTGDITVALIAVVFIIIMNGIGLGIILPIVSHILIRLLGGTRPTKDTFQMYFYTSTPSLLLSWIPGIGILSGLVSFGNVFRGLKTINEFPFWKAIISVLLPSLIYWGIWALLIVGLTG